MNLNNNLLINKNKIKNFIFGIDESGRGCLIGSMFITIFGLDYNIYNEEFENNINIKDSKKLNIKNINKMAKQFLKVNNSYNKTFKLTARLLDYYKNLNQLQIYFIKEELDNILMIYEYPTIIIDKFDLNLEKHLLYYKDKCNLIITYKADDNYKICSMSSIICKYNREKFLNKIILKLQENNKEITFFSGYLTDKKTKDYLKSKNFIDNTDDFYYIRKYYNIKLD